MSTTPPRRTKRLLLSLSAAEHLLLKSVAAQRGVSMSELVRTTVFTAVAIQEKPRVREY